MDRNERETLQRELAKLADGERSAFHPVFVCLWPLLRGFAARCLPWQEAEDTAQEALLRVFSRASEFDRERDALSWVLGITAFEIRTTRRRRERRREERSEALATMADREPSPETAAMASELARLLDSALATLPRSDVETLVAYARGERPNLPGATFRKRVERALGRLRVAWRASS